MPNPYTSSNGIVKIQPTDTGEWIDRDLGVIRIMFSVGQAGWSTLQNPAEVPPTYVGLMCILSLDYPILGVLDDKNKPIGMVRVVATSYRNAYKDPLGGSLSTRMESVGSIVNPDNVRTEMIGGWSEGDARLIVTENAVVAGGGTAGSQVFAIGNDGVTVIANTRLEQPNNVLTSQLSNGSDIFREWIPKTIVTPFPNEYPFLSGIVSKIGKVIKNVADIRGLANMVSAMNTIEESSVETIISKLKQLVD